MPRRNIIIGQSVDPVKADRARQLRRELTEEERILWQRLRTNRLHGLHFRRQQVIDGFIIDFYCHASGLVVEVDGATHDARGPYDAERDKVLAARGLRTLRIKNEEIRQDLPGVLRRIAEACGKT